MIKNAAVQSPLQLPQIRSIPLRGNDFNSPVNPQNNSEADVHGHRYSLRQCKLPVTCTCCK